MLLNGLRVKIVARLVLICTTESDPKIWLKNGVNRGSNWKIVDNSQDHHVQLFGDNKFCVQGTGTDKTSRRQNSILFWGMDIAMSEWQTTGICT